MQNTSSNSFISTHNKKLNFGHKEIPFLTSLEMKTILIILEYYRNLIKDLSKMDQFLKENSYTEIKSPCLG